jgi:DNA repair protein RecO (recombination protein O)
MSILDADLTPTVRPDAPAPVGRRSRPAARDNRVLGQPAFVLHSYPYKETSLIIDLLTRDFGRVAVVAKGAKRPMSKLRAVLQTFQPLQTAWSGKSELRTLIDAEWVGGMLPLERTALLCGFYLNELLVKLLARDDPHPALFDQYVATLNELAHGEPAQIALRKFERALLKETGVAADLSRSTTTRAFVEPAADYVVDPEKGARGAGGRPLARSFRQDPARHGTRRLRGPGDAGAKQTTDALPAGASPGGRAVEHAPDIDRLNAAIKRP